MIKNVNKNLKLFEEAIKCETKRKKGQEKVEYAKNCRGKGIEYQGFGKASLG